MKNKWIKFSFLQINKQRKIFMNETPLFDNKYKQRENRAKVIMLKKKKKMF